MTHRPLDADAFPGLIEARDFEVSDEMRILALQGDWDLVEQTGPTGGRYVIANHDSAHEAYLTFLDRVSTSNVQLAMMPELAIPVDTVVDIISAVQGLTKSLVFLGVCPAVQSVWRALPWREALDLSHLLGWARHR